MAISLEEVNVAAAYREDPERWHILTFAETGFSAFSHIAADYGVDKSTASAFAEMVNQKNELGSLSPTVPISAIPRWLFRDNEDASLIENAIFEFFELNRKTIRASSIGISLICSSNSSITKEAIVAAVAKEDRDGTPVTEVIFSA